MQLVRPYNGKEGKLILKEMQAPGEKEQTTLSHCHVFAHRDAGFSVALGPGQELIRLSQSRSHTDCFWGILRCVQKDREAEGEREREKKKNPPKVNPVKMKAN